MKEPVRLHVISFNIPLPADYGGVIGVYFHLKALHKLGVKIILHCFEYGREHDAKLNEVCETVYYYKRNMSLINLISTKPFIVKSRTNKVLLNRLLQYDFPILYEGTHVCMTLDEPKLKDRLKVVRMHNVEWQYYENMIPIEKSLKQKVFFYLESK
ncbi:MAG: glycosyltransferase family 1 protein, partial [Saprospiraceae bacterium]